MADDTNSTPWLLILLFVLLALVVGAGIILFLGGSFVVGTAALSPLF